VFFQILKTLERLRAAVGLATPLLVLAVLLRKRMRASVLLAIAAIAVPFVLASPVVANSLEQEVEHSVRDTTKPGVEYDVAIVLSGKPEERLDPAIDLLRSGRAGLLLYSGMTDPGEARAVASILRSGRVRGDEVLFERSSRTTHENAVESARVVRDRGWKRIVLVTGAIHARRALACFHKAGLFPDLLPVLRKRPRGVLPQWWALDVSTAVVHEMVGLIAYRVAGYAD
jgi:uncharacterized SAM-binding protein YcdF (DUF218 family)